MPTDKRESLRADSSRQDSLLCLREMAEEHLREKKTRLPKVLAIEEIEDAHRLIFELQTHQIELEMQNDQLRQTQAELEDARKRYFDFYEISPVGHITLSAKGLILKANLTAANLLGIPRGCSAQTIIFSFYSS